MKRTSTTYWIESLKDGKEQIVGHSKKGKQIFYEFLDKSSALKLMSEEKKVSPEYKYRLVTSKKTIDFTSWS